METQAQESQDDENEKKEKVAHESHNTKLGNTSWHAKPLSTKAHHHSFNLAHHQRVCESL